ncbi:hypothetical protein LguiA_030331 [Lonicera macranthoides]
MSMQVNDLIPLDDIIGKTIQQVALEALFGFEGIERDSLKKHMEYICRLSKYLVDIQNVCRLSDSLRRHTVFEESKKQIEDLEKNRKSRHCVEE